MTSAVFFSFITSLFICMALIPPLQLNAGRWRFMDLPGERKVHANPIPRIGGIAFGFRGTPLHFFLGTAGSGHYAGVSECGDHPGIRHLGRPCQP
jgi:UDP-N-acetylmuramyl pentapeptide phosphotransferase/UDP-N-acetylglucosamine-1-phosphate transferase